MMTSNGIHRIVLSQLSRSCLYCRYILPRHFIQEWVHPQLLLEGHSLDFGLDVVITSVSPLRAYVRDEAIVR